MLKSERMDVFYHKELKLSSTNLIYVSSQNKYGE